MQMLENAKSEYNLSADEVKSHRARIIAEIADMEADDMLTNALREAALVAQLSRCRREPADREAYRKSAKAQSLQERHTADPFVEHGDAAPDSDLDT